MTEAIHILSQDALRRLVPLVLAELGDVVAGLKPGRRSDPDITPCDLTGTGVQDTAIAAFARRRAAASAMPWSR